MFTIREKIAAEADAEAILDQSYNLVAPLGVPTLIFDPADYSYQKSFWSFLQRGESVEVRVRRKVTQLLHSFYGQDNTDVINALAERTMTIADITIALQRLQDSQSFVASSIPHSLFNAVICPRTKDLGYFVLKHGLKMPEDKIPDMPGYNAQWVFLMLWHEFAHGLIGRHEDHAEKISALVHQYTFADPSPLIAASDCRAAHAILNHEKPQLLESYGWAPVEAIDDVLAMDAPATWDDVMTQAIIPPQSHCSAKDVMFVGKSLKAISKLAFAEPDLLMLSMMTDSILYRGNIENDNQRRIAERFALAAKRISMGAAAYATPALKLSL